MKLLEREIYFSELNELFKKAANGTGNIAAVCGEAGIGKTSLIELFTKKMETKAEILWGACDDLFTPRPLAPFYDIALSLKKEIINELDSGRPRPSVFAHLFEELKLNEPNIIVIEDAHWADEASLDLIKFLGRRINRSKSLLLISYRDDEVTSDHPLRQTLGTIASGYFKRIKLLPLSENSISILMRSYGKFFKNIYEQTGGNPFFVTEILSNNENEIPGTIKDLINSKLVKLPEQSQRAVELISVIPNRIERDMLKELIKDFSALDKPIEYGLLKSNNDNIAFRHELSRLSVEESLSESDRINTNKIVLEFLLSKKNKDHYLARIIHHAEKAQDIETIIKFAPLAAKQASKLGAHYQASKHYLTALKYEANLDYNLKIEFLEGRAYECTITGQIDEGIEACKSIIKILRDNNDPYREAQTYRRLSRLLWYAGEDEEGEIYLKKAITILESQNNQNELAMAISNLSQMYMCREDSDQAIKWGEKALKLARKINDLEIEIHSLCNLGSAKMLASDDTGEELLMQSLELSLKNDFHDHASRAYANIGSAYLYKRNLSEAEKYFSVGLDYCNDKDLYTHGLCISAETSKTKLYLGQWDEAVEYASVIFKNDAVPVIDRVISLCVIGIIRARRNDPDALKLIEQAYSIALKTGELMKIVSATSALAEYYWLNNKLDEVTDKIQFVYDKYKNNRNPWATGELAFWLWKAGRLSNPSKNIAEPFRLQMNGNWLEAFKIWESLECPYEKALALADGDESANKKALEIFELLGANAALQLIKRKMREAGIKKIPVGPRKSTKESPAGLTKRQTEVLILLSKGLHNTDIADSLFISPKTVDHHISAIFSKLNIHSRTEAAAFVHSNDILVK